MPVHECSHATLDTRPSSGTIAEKSIGRAHELRMVFAGVARMVRSCGMNPPPRGALFAVRIGCPCVGEVNDA